MEENQAVEKEVFRMRTRYLALIVGIVFTLVGISGFVPALVSSPPSTAPAIAVDAGYGYLMGIFPINVLHNFVHLAAGLLGIAAYWSFSFAKIYAQGMAIFYGVLAVMGFIPGANTMFNLIPIFGNDIWFHGLIAAITGYFGFIAPERLEDVDTQKLA